MARQTLSLSFVFKLRHIEYGFLICRTALRILLPVLLLFSPFILFRGYHKPGGEFVYGRHITARAFATDVRVRVVRHTKQYFPKNPVMFLLPVLVHMLATYCL